MNPVYLSVVGVIGILVGFIVSAITSKKAGKGKIKLAEEQAAKIVKSAEDEIKNLKRSAELEVKDAKLQAKMESEKQAQEKQKELQQMEKRLLTKEDNLEKKFNLLENKEAELRKQDQSSLDKKRHVENLEKKYRELVEDAQRKLEKLAGISKDKAKEELKNALIDDAKRETSSIIKKIEDETRETAKKEAQKIISVAIERMASDYVSERTVSVVQLPNEEMKGRIIGREGRNIRALEAATGVDIIIDDTPEAVILSCFNPIRREVARVALENLVQDGRIHPTRIEEVVGKAGKEIEQSIWDTGEAALMELDVHDVHPELIKLLGALKYRYSYAQNVLQHSKDVAFLAGMMAGELGYDERKVRRAAILHDIGKAVTHEVKGSHALIGMEFAKKYREAPEICHAIGAHHEDLPQESILDCIVDAADALSGARPGARREVLETYVKRIEDLEKIGKSFIGVDKVYAIQAGREVRVLVNYEDITDADAVVLSRDIAKKIEEEMKYPGEIKVTVVRETRAIEFAR
ncbi:ribonuclease Y [bacterium]|nr:ribonuclease Y [bacterium]